MFLASLDPLHPCHGAAPDCQVSWSEREVGVLVRQPELFAGTLETMLDSGLELRLDEQVDLVGEDGRVVATGRWVVRAVFDLWNERYVIQTSDDPTARRTIVEKSEALVLIRQARILVPWKTVRANERLHLRVEAKLAPSAAGADERSKEWLARARSSPGTAEDAGSSNLFVAFADLFGIPEAEESVHTSYTVGPCASGSEPVPTVRVNRGSGS